MHNETQGNEQQLNLSVDLGGGRQVDVEIGTSDQLWVSAGPGIGLGDVWMKDEGRLIDSESAHPADPRRRRNRRGPGRYWRSMVARRWRAEAGGRN